jgi:hypothetical protein
MKRYRRQIVKVVEDGVTVATQGRTECLIRSCAEHKDAGSTGHAVIPQSCRGRVNERAWFDDPERSTPDQRPQGWVSGLVALNNIELCRGVSSASWWVDDTMLWLEISTWRSAISGYELRSRVTCATSGVLDEDRAITIDARGAWSGCNQATVTAAALRKTLRSAAAHSFGMSR